MPYTARMSGCLHCGTETGSAESFCCAGCAAAYALLRDRGLDLYYHRRSIDPAVRPLRPDETVPAADYRAYIRDDGDGGSSLDLMVDGLQCAACVWLIETLLNRQPCVTSARLNMTTRRLAVRWRSGETAIESVLAPVLAVGYRLVPYDPALLVDKRRQEEKELLRLMGIAGFAAGNVMLLSVSVWAGYFDGMGPATRDLLHWFSALIALPALVWCLRPFLRSALGALRHGRTNMDVPICLGVILAAAMSLFETVRHGEYAYFDAAITLVFFLLVGRYLDSRARGKARSAAEDLLMLRARALTVIDETGQANMVAPDAVRVGMTVLTASGETVGVDGVVIEGRSDVDVSLITGESLPAAAGPGDTVFAGTLNLGAALRIRVTATDDKTLLADIVRLMEAAEGGRAGYRALADRVARLYAPVVHLAALLTFLGWILAGGLAWQESLLRAVAVLIITCPCALALAVPVVHVVAAGRLMRRGILLKSPTALERMAGIDGVVFDKTGTLTTGHLELNRTGAWNDEDLRCAAGIAASGRHPLDRALVRACPEATAADDVREIPGSGLQAGAVRLGSRIWCGIARPETQEGTENETISGDPELWLTRPGYPAVRFTFTDHVRRDAAETIRTLKECGLTVEILSGDRSGAVESTARRLDVEQWQASCTPADKHARLDGLATQGRRILMVGDGLNDAPALAAAHVSMSPSSAADVSQTAADAVFQGNLLAPVVFCRVLALRAQRLIRQNLALALGYNLFTVPLAVAGFVTPLVAAISMSASSLVVILNALRLGRIMKETRP